MYILQLIFLKPEIGLFERSSSLLKYPATAWTIDLGSKADYFGIYF
jgi:hypothetical protein